MTFSFWKTRRGKLVAAGLIGVLAAAGMMRSGRDYVGYVLGVVSAVVGILALQRRSRQEMRQETVYTVANRELQAHNAAIRHSVADVGGSMPADVRFRVPRADTERGLVGWRDDGGDAGGTLRQLVGYYQRMERRRLAILAKPGGGKTVAARILARDLIRELLDESSSVAGRHVAVPVLLSLPGWSLRERWLRAATDDELAKAFEMWIVTHLVVAHGVPRSDARELVAEGWVVPVLDGLDEMDPAGSPDRPRADAVVRTLNGPWGARAVVLACRLDEYQRLASGGSRLAGEAPVPEYMQPVVLEDLTFERIRDYLTHRFSDRTRETGVQVRWEPLLEALAPGGHRPDLTATLARPWRLFLAVTAYHARDSDPSELMRIPPTTVVDHLLTQLIPVVTARHRRPGRRYGYRPDRVEAWLAAVAQHLRETNAEHGWSPIDLRLDDLWPIAGWVAPRVATAILRLVVFGALTAVVLWMAALSGQLGTPLVTGAVAAILVVAVAAAWRERDPRPVPVGRHDTRPGMRRQRFLSSTTIGLLLGSATGFGGGMILGFESGRAVIGVAGGLSVGVAVGLATGRVSRARETWRMDRPSRLLRHDLVSDLRFALAPIVTSTTVLGIWYVPVASSVAASPVGVAILMAVGAVLGAIAGVVTGAIAFLTISRWPRYWMAVAMAARRGVLPARSAAFFDWAYAAGLLRLSGISVQFRHHELQNWLDARNARQSIERYASGWV